MSHSDNVDTALDENYCPVCGWAWAARRDHSGCDLPSTALLVANGRAELAAANAALATITIGRANLAAEIGRLEYAIELCAERGGKSEENRERLSRQTNQTASERRRASSCATAPTWRGGDATTMSAVELSYAPSSAPSRPRLGLA